MLVDRNIKSLDIKRFQLCFMLDDRKYQSLDIKLLFVLVDRNIKD